MDTFHPRIHTRITVPPYSARAVEVNAGEELYIIDAEGKQVSDFICLNRDDLSEYVSPVHMRSSLSSIRLRVGDYLYSNRRDKLMQLVEDTVGKHDFFFPACDYYRYKVDFGVEDHPNCHDNLLKALSEHGICINEIPDPINWFMNNMMNDDGDYTICEPLSKPGDFVRLKALKNCIIACTTCSQDFVPVNAMKVTPIALHVASM